ncbi:MAG: hypothetical protein Ct9H90mP10_07050 [Actinomycetota bacterium]|nr:MAG: hypothetical protein Ct9H90mP10_07050 [Actinomycetota bacterium]
MTEVTNEDIKYLLGKFQAHLALWKSAEGSLTV